MQPANMTGLAQPPNPGRMRHQDPPQLWQKLFAGSVGVHLLLLLTLPTLLQAANQSEAGMQASTPIELVDLDSSGVGLQDTPGEGSAAIDAPNPAVNPPSTPAPNPESAIAPTTAQPSITSAFAPTVLESDRPLPQSPTPSPPQPFPSPLPSPSPSSLAPSPQVTPPLDSPLPLPSPPFPPPPLTPSDPSPPTRASSPDSSIPSSPDASPQTEETAPSRGELGERLEAPNTYPGDVATNPSLGGGLAGEGNPDATGNTPGEGLSEISVNRQGLPTSLTVSVVSTSQMPPSETSDVPEISAVLLTNSFTVVADPTQPGACQITPESVNFFGATVVMRVTVEQAGRVSETQIQQDSGSAAYNELAACLVQQNLEFTPASTAGIEIPSSNLVVSITVVGSN